MAERPGVMFYFDLEPALKLLSNEEAGQLFKASMEYGHYGVVPEFDGLAAMAWSFVQPKIDRDNEAYKQKCMDNAYNRYKGVCKDRGTDPLDKAVWAEQIYLPSLTTVNNGCNPSPTTTPTTAPTTNSSSKTDADGGGSGGRRGKTSTLRPLPEDEESQFLRKRDEAICQLNEHLKNGRS